MIEPWTKLAIISTLVANLKNLKDAVVFVEDRLISPASLKNLSSKSESWWYKVYGMGPSQFAGAVAGKSSELLTVIFGQSIFTWSAFKRSVKIATGLLFGCLFFSSFLGNGVEPMTEFTTTVETLVQLHPPDKPGNSPEAELERKIGTVAQTLNTDSWKIAFWFFFYSSLFAVNALVFFLSVSFSRKTLAAIAKAEDAFTACVLLTVNTLLTVVAASIVLQFYSVLAFPVLSVFPILTFFLSRISFAFLFVSLFNGGVAAWAFGNSSLRFAAAISVLPSMVTMIVCFLSIFTIWNRKRLHDLCCYLIDKTSGHKPFSVLLVIFVGLLIVLWLGFVGITYLAKLIN